MSFQAYLDNIRVQTGMEPEDFLKKAISKDFVDSESLELKVKATAITDWLKSEFGLGHGHAMSIFAWLKGKRN